MTKQRYTDRVTVSDWKIYFTHPEVQQFLLAAAQAGPVAMTAALGTVVATPGIGTVIGAMIGAFGGISVICYYALQASYNGQGLYMVVEWNGKFPNPVIGTW